MNWVEWMKGICHIWSRGRLISPSMPVGDDWYLNLNSQKRPPSRNLGEHRLVRRSGATSRGTVVLVFYLRMRSFLRTEVPTIFIGRSICVGSTKNLTLMTKFTRATWLRNVYITVVWSLELEITLITALPKLSCSILFYCYFYNIKPILVVKRVAVFMHIIIWWQAATRCRDRRHFPGSVLSSHCFLLRRLSSVSAWRFSSYVCAPSNTVHLYLTDFLPPLPRGSPIGFFNPAIPTGIFPHCSLHIWPFIINHRQSQLRRQFAHSQFSIIWKSHKIEYNCT